MKEGKRVKLISSAMKEFGTNRYDKASTNLIINEAGISKEILCHYLETKESLYNYLILFTINSIGIAIVDRVR